MITARQKVLAHLKKTRLASAREIARALKMSAPNVRHHLSVLCSDGRVELATVHPRGGRGRPEKMYSLSQSVLGDNLSALADALLDGKINMAVVAQRVAQSRNLIVPVNQAMAKRLTALIEKLNEMHYQARWEAGAEGPRVIFGRCPYAKIVEKHPELCTMDTALLEMSLTRPVLRNGKADTNAHGSCPFVFKVG